VKHSHVVAVGDVDGVCRGIHGHGARVGDPVNVGDDSVGRAVDVRNKSRAPGQLIGVVNEDRVGGSVRGDTELPRRIPVRDRECVGDAVAAARNDGHLGATAAVPRDVELAGRWVVSEPSGWLGVPSAFVCPLIVQIPATAPSPPAT
jgi:hypothetical protein